MGRTLPTRLSLAYLPCRANAIARNGFLPDYCRATAIELGIEDCFVAFLPKPRIMIDDQEVKDWVFCTTFHPTTCAGKRLEDYFKI